MPSTLGLPLLATLIIPSPVAALVLLVLPLNGNGTPAFGRRCAGSVFVLPPVALMGCAI